MKTKFIRLYKSSIVVNKKTNKMFASFLLFFAISAAAQGRMTIQNGTVVSLHGGTSTNPIVVVVDNNNTNAITTSGSGHIRSEAQFNIIRWNIENGTGNYVVPFGDNNSVLLPVSLDIATAGSADGAVNFSMYGTGVDNLPMPVGVSSLEHVDILGDGLPPPPADGAKVYDRYWFIDAVDYTTKPEGNIAFSYDPLSQTGDLVAGTTAMQAQFHNGTGWSLSQLGSDDLSGLVSGVAVSNASFFSTFALVESGAPLPITLLSFNAVWGDQRKSHAKVFWSTASEENNDYFDIERSQDGANWHRIDRVNGAGTSINTLHYQIIDGSPLNNTSYYRLKQVDYDGKFSYSHPVALKRELNGAAITVHPNPASNNFFISFEGFKSEVTNINILDNSGRIVLAQNNNVLNNPVQIINASGFQSGVYYIHVTSETESFVEKIVIKN